MLVRRLLAAVGGITLIVSVLYTVYHTAHRMYYDYYFYAQVKEHYIKPDGRTRLLDAIFVVGVILVLYVAYRLLKNALRVRPPATP